LLIVKTRNVDVTIANILDGIVTYTPEPNPVQPSATSYGNSLENPAKKISGTSSLQERKAKMIREARERYIKKHGLTDC